MASTQMVCPSCDATRPLRDGFCAECGAALVPARFCERCGVIATHGGDFCRECGAALPPVEPAPQPKRQAAAPPTGRPFAEPPPADVPAWVRDAPPAASAPPRPAAVVTTQPAPVVTTRPGAMVASSDPSAAPPVVALAPLSAVRPAPPVRGAALVGWTLSTLVLGVLAIAAVAAEPIAFPFLLVLVLAALGPLKRLSYSLLAAFVDSFWDQNR